MHILCKYTCYHFHQYCFVADSLLTETITNNPPILRDLGECLDTEYQHGQVPCWRDLAELLDIPPEAYEHCGTFSATSPTEDLFVFLAATKPQLTIQDVQEALREIDRHEVAQLLDRKIAGLCEGPLVVFHREYKYWWWLLLLNVLLENHWVRSCRPIAWHQEEFDLGVADLRWWKGQCYFGQVTLLDASSMLPFWVGVGFKASWRVAVGPYSPHMNGNF